MTQVSCDVQCQYQRGGECKLKHIKVDAQGLDTFCATFDRLIENKETTTVFSYGKANDTLETIS